MSTPCRHCGLAPMHGKPRHRPTCPFELPDTAVGRELAEHPEFAAWNDEADKFWALLSPWTFPEESQ